MVDHHSLEKLSLELQERNKELNCLYSIEQTINDKRLSFNETLQRIAEIVPSGWQYPHFCKVKIKYLDNVYSTDGYEESYSTVSIPLTINENEIGNISVTYITDDSNGSDERVFLREEHRLLKSIADRISSYIDRMNLQLVVDEFQRTRGVSGSTKLIEWRIVLDILRKTDPNLFMRILRKLLHQLCWKNVEGADELLKQSGIDYSGDDDVNPEDENRPLKKTKIENFDHFVASIINLTYQTYNDHEILAKITKWIQNDKTSELVKTLELQGSSLADISDAIRKFFHMAPEKIEISISTIKGLRVSLLRRIFSEDLDFIKLAKEYVKLTDFYYLIDKMIFLPGSHGKLGGKSSGLFLASNILRVSHDREELPFEVKIPKTWYVTSDCVLAFIQYNNLDEVFEQKYKDMDEIRMEYPHVVQMFKNSQFPPDIVKGLSMALDDLGDRPIVVRSSSLLEDQLGAAFSGKYKSLFLANQGTKAERLTALLDAIAEVYASTFGPDPIEYRAERDLLDFHEEMGIMIMEVVGTKVGDYFMPTFAGVAFSNNEFRWSPRIKRDDGLVRIVPGLGTRAVDRVSDDYPILLAPGQPNLKVNVTMSEAIRYSPKKLDVINLKSNTFETIDLADLLKSAGHNYPGIENVISEIQGNMLRRPSKFDLDFDHSEYVVTFDGIINKSDFVQKMHMILKILQGKFNTPVDIEFASDGKDLYLLQCRPQSYTKQNIADKIPTDINPAKVVFSANKFISNGRVPEASHIVYVDPVKYAELPTRELMLEVGTVIGRLNKILPRRKFILMGPGRWGSRGDIKLGVSITYSQINNTSLLIEIARQQGNYKPDLSFGTHFFQDMVEANIRYLPLFPDDEGTIFNEEFLKGTPNKLDELLPDYSDLSEVVRVIDVSSVSKGEYLKVYVNAEQEIAIAMLRPHESESAEGAESQISHVLHQEKSVLNEIEMFEKMCSDVNKAGFGLEEVIYFETIAEKDSKKIINLLISVNTDDKTKEEIRNWIEGWLAGISQAAEKKNTIQKKTVKTIFVDSDEFVRKQKYLREKKIHLISLFKGTYKITQG